MRGKPDIRRYWHRLRETWSGLRLDPVEVLDVGGRYVVELRLWGKGQRSGAEVEQQLAMLYEIRSEDQKAISIRMLPDMATALSEAEAARSL